MDFKKVIGILVLIFVFIIACAGTSEESGTKQLAVKTETSTLNEPWTGIWRVESALAEAKGLWELKQSGNSVVSKGNSLPKVKGKVKGDQLKGTVAGGANVYTDLILNISSDRQSFKGLWIYNTRRWHLEGVKEQ